LGFAVEDIEYLGIAERKGVGSTDLTKAEIHEYNTEAKTQSQFVPSRLSQRLGKNVVAGQGLLSLLWQLDSRLAPLR